MPHIGPILEGRGDTDYERYVRVPELLELQKPVEKLASPEERLFQVTHQAADVEPHRNDHGWQARQDQRAGEIIPGGFLASRLRVEAPRGESFLQFQKGGSEMFLGVELLGSKFSVSSITNWVDGE